MNVAEIFRNISNDSKITVQITEEENIIITCPPKGITLKTVYQFVFMFVWLSFMGFLTIISTYHLIFPFIFFIPFWIVGIKTLRGIIVINSEHQTLLLTNDRITITKQTKKQFLIDCLPINEIGPVDTEKFKMNFFAFFRISYRMLYLLNTRHYNGEIYIPAILHRDKKIYFFENADEDTQKRIINAINIYISFIKKKTEIS